MKREDWNDKYAASGFLWSTEPNRFLVAEVASLAPGRALDLACGEGRHAVWLAQQGWQVTAVDFSKVALAKAERLARSRRVEVEWIAADLLEYEPAGPFDFVVVLYLQLPADERRLVLRRAADALGPGGTLLVCGHDLTNLTKGHGGPTRAEVLFTPDDIVEDLAPLTVERAERVARDGAIDALVRATRPL
jgi:2-polyprenyl-3-methyl-5-hydroxy-6-metoxy-1,4-benzoquinol methylase